MNRHPGHDYSAPGYYFVTISTAGYRSIFGRLGTDNRIVLSNIGWIAEQVWQRNDQIYSSFRNDVYCFMPNHLHALVQIESDGKSDESPPNLSTVIRSFKGCVTKEVRRHGGRPDLVIWQHNFHDRIVRSDRSLAAIRNYIANNPGALESRIDDLLGTGNLLPGPRWPGED
ncbi:MAG: transposase [bacterium]